jgi:ComF family protein
VKFSSFISTISSLVFPIRCPSCFLPSAQELTEFGICSTCKGSIDAVVSITNRGPLRIFAGSQYTPNLSRIILAAKEQNQIQARVFLAECLYQSMRKALAEISFTREQAIKNIVLVPIPSRRLADRKRGFAHVELLIAQLIDRNKSLNFQVLNCLIHSRKISDQTSLNFNERALNMKGAFLVDQIKYLEIYPTKNSNSVVFLVDDLVTTGATVQAANSALSTLGARVDGVLASCATPGFTH